VPGPREPDRGVDELVLAVREVVVDRAARRTGTLQHVAERVPCSPRIASSVTALSIIFWRASLGTGAFLP
jgi:hypothetical protein